MSQRIDKLREAVEVMHKCKAAHAGSTPIPEMFGPKVVWEGVVESFDIAGHPKANRCHAWAFTDDKGEAQYVTVLEIPPVKDPRTAVQAAIVAKTKAK